MVRDRISDYIVRLKNAQAVSREVTTVPYTDLLWEISKKLEETGYVSKIDRRGKRIQRSIELSFKYDKDGIGKIDGVRRISKLSRRIYKKSTELFPIKHGRGHSIISTSKGIMTDAEARKGKVGGEVLFEIW
ncbi:MAG: 30S ribosomal protein S8 [bacterium]|nr:30S ribosomal protein S8 [bacterium]